MSIKKHTSENRLREYEKFIQERENEEDSLIAKIGCVITILGLMFFWLYMFPSIF